MWSEARFTKIMSGMFSTIDSKKRRSSSSSERPRPIAMQGTLASLCEQERPVVEAVRGSDVADSHAAHAVDANDARPERGRALIVENRGVGLDESLHGRTIAGV